MTFCVRVVVVGFVREVMAVGRGAGPPLPPGCGDGHRPLPSRMWEVGMVQRGSCPPPAAHRWPGRLDRADLNGRGRVGVAEAGGGAERRKAEERPPSPRKRGRWRVAGASVGKDAGA